MPDGLVRLRSEAFRKSVLASVLRADAANPFNIVRWSNPNTSITSAGFGVISGSQAARVVQLSLTVSF